MREIAPNGKAFESVWDYPRPPRLERVEWRIRVVHASEVIVDAPWAVRILETSQAPAYYVSAEFVDPRHVRSSEHRSFCEWKGVAHYCDVVVGEDDAGVVPRAGWTYPEPTSRFAALAGMWAFYALAVDACFVDDERVESNEGSFYGGWVTANVTGPFKGGPGSTLW
ncbi:MAG: DUF427 domain-containing protein [Ilumatobacteraceae bacterium]